MGKSVPDSVMDAILDEIATSTRMDVTSDVSTPTDLSNSLANVTMSGGDYTKNQGDAGAGSRKLVMSLKSGVSVTGNGSINHVVLSLASVIKLTTTADGPDLTIGSNVNFLTWKYELGIPT